MNNPLKPRTITVQPRWVEEEDAHYLKVLDILVSNVWIPHQGVYIAYKYRASEILYSGPDLAQARAACEAYLAEWLESIGTALPSEQDCLDLAYELSGEVNEPSEFEGEILPEEIIIETEKIKTLIAFCQGKGGAR